MNEKYERQMKKAVSVQMRLSIHQKQHCPLMMNLSNLESVLKNRIKKAVA